MSPASTTAAGVVLRLKGACCKEEGNGAFESDARTYGKMF